MNDILISKITVRSSLAGHVLVLTSDLGHLLEDDISPPSITIVNAIPQNGGPIIGQRYKIRFNVAGEMEAVRGIAFMGITSHPDNGGNGPWGHTRYVFSYA